MNNSEKLSVCSICKNRKHSLQKGIVCGLTDEKPDFEAMCPEYVQDEKEVLKSTPPPVVTDPDEPKLIGANWLKTVALLSLLNIILNLVDVSFIFGLGVTQIAQVGVMEEVINSALGWATVIGVPLFFLFTWWMVETKGSRLAYLIGILVYLFDAYALYWLYDLTDESTLIIDLAIHGFLAIYFIYGLVMSPKPQIDNEQKSADSSTHTLLYAGVAIIVSVVSYLSFSEFKTFVEEPWEYYLDNYSDYNYGYDYG